MGIPGFITYYIFIAAFSIGFLVMGLIWWHGRMIGRGVTSLERMLNQEYAHQCYEQGFLFVNPYDFGLLENWKRFLGVVTIGDFIRRVLLPSTHKSTGDGITWDGYNVNTNLQLRGTGHARTTRPIVHLPEFYPNFPGGYPRHRQPSIVPPWEMPSRSMSSSPGYQPQPPSSYVPPSKKDG